MSSILPTRRLRCSSSEQGFALVGLLVAIFIILLVLSIAAPTVARSLRRQRETEAIARANQYVRAIRLFYKKNGRYPASLDELEKSNNIRYLRRRYGDPFTGKPDWRLIKVGENQTTVKGLFGQPLAGIAATGISGASALPSGIGGSTSMTSSSASGTSPSTSGTSTSATGTSSGTSSSGTNSASGGFGSLSSSSATGFAGSGAPFLGVGLPIPGTAMTVVNEKDAYKEWEFLYDPRIEQLRSRVNIFGGSMGANGASSLGSSGSFGSSGTFGSSGSATPNGLGGSGGPGSAGTFGGSGASSSFGSMAPSSGSSPGSSSPSSGSSGSPQTAFPQQ